MLKLPIAPMGKLLTCLPRLSLAQLRPTLWSTTQWVRAAETSNFPIAPMGFSHVLRLCLQGGGVSIGSGSGTVTFSSCTITGNTAYDVRAHTQNSPSPR